MAGDRINDAPALNRHRDSHGNRNGCSHWCKITLSERRFARIVKAKKLSHAVMKNINQNLFCLLLQCTRPIAAGVLYPFSVFTFAMMQH
jgi:Cu2+-exporting ATPase